MKKRLVFFVLTLMSTGLTYAQSVEDVRRFSQSTYLGSARYMGSGGAFISLGNDFTSIHQNPAGLAVFRRTEVHLSMGGLNSGSTSYLQGVSRIDDVNGFNFGNVGLVFALPVENEWKWNFGFSLNRNVDYRNRLTVRGETENISRINMWIDNSQGYHPDEMLQNGLTHEWLAYQAYLTDADGNLDYSTKADLSSIDNVQTLDQSGGTSELAIALAAETENRLYFGGSVNITFTNFTRDIVYSERFNMGDSIASFDLKEHNEISGAGVNLKFGAQYRFDNGFRLGAAIHSPTWMTLEQSWEDEIFSRFKDGTSLSEVVSVYSDPYTWKLATPWKGLFGVSKVFEKKGFLSVDYELNALSTASSKSDSVNIDYLKSEIKAYTQLAHVLRIGGELRLNSFYLRGGYGFETNGLSSEFEKANTSSISFGAGYRGRDLTIDFAYVIRNTTQNFFFYDSNYAPAIQTDIVQRPFMISLSYRIGNRG